MFSLCTMWKIYCIILLCSKVYGAKENNAVILPHSAQIKHAFLGEIKEMPKKNKLPARKRIALEFYIKY